MCWTACTTSPVPASPLVRIMAAPSAMRRRASPRLRAPQTKGVVKACLSMWCASSAGVRTSLSSMIIDAQLLQNLCLGDMADAGLGHDGDGNSLNDLLDERGARHAGHAAFGADHGGDALESHDGCGAGLFGDASLLDGHDVHDDAALEHLGEADFEAQAGAGETVIFCRFRHLFGPRRAADSARGGMKSRKVFPTLSVAAK